MKLLVISLCTTGVMKDHFISYCRCFSQYNELYCITNDNVSCEELSAKETLNLYYKRNKKFSYFSISKVNKIKRFIKKIKPDVIYVFTPHPVNILIARFLKSYNLIFQVHDPVPHSKTAFLERILLSIQLKQYYRYSDKLIVAGNFLKEQIIENHKTLVNKIVVVPFAAVGPLIDKDTIKADLSKQQNDIDLLYFGRIEYYKGLDILFDALNLINDPIRCYVIGRGDINKAYGQNIKIPDKVIFVNDYVSDEDLASKIIQSKIIVLPYRDATGSMTVSQAYFYGKPVIATDVGVFPEYVKEGGIIIERENPQALANAIKKILNDNVLIDRLSENAKRIYNDNYTFKIMNDSMQNVFMDLLNETK